jgi:hypothetical protein
LRFINLLYVVFVEIRKHSLKGIRLCLY